MFVIGIDPHRGSHTAAVLDGTEELLAEYRVVADRRQCQRLLEWGGAVHAADLGSGRRHWHRGAVGPTACRRRRAGAGLNPRGNRQLNHALHMAAVTQVRNDTPGRAYYLRKQAEGKSKKDAMRALHQQPPRRPAPLGRSRGSMNRAPEPGDLHKPDLQVIDASPATPVTRAVGHMSGPAERTSGVAWSA